MIEQTQELRATGIGGSDAAGVCGLSRWTTPVKIYLEKIGELPPVEENEAMKWGKRLEPLIADVFEEETGIKVRRYSTAHTLRHPDYPHLMGHVDRKIEGRPWGLECKSAGKYYDVHEWGESWTDLVPPDYFLQCQHYMMITNWEKFYLAVLLASNDFRIYEILRDETIIANLLVKENAFWELVQKRTPPEPVSTLDTKLLWPKDNGETVIATDEIAGLIRRYNKADGLEKVAKEIKEETRTKIETFMQVNGRLIDMQGNQLATWKLENGGNRLDLEALKQDYPLIVTEYSKPTTRKVFRPKKEKSKQ